MSFLLSAATVAFAAFSAASLAAAKAS